MTDDDDLFTRNIGKGKTDSSMDQCRENDDEDISDRYGAADEGFEDDRKIFQKNNSDGEDLNNRETGSDNTDVSMDSDCENDEEFEEDLFTRDIGKGRTMGQCSENDDDEDLSDRYGVTDEGFEEDRRIFQKNNSDE